MRIARMGMARIRRLMLHAPQSLFLRELVTQPGAVGAICASSPQLAARMAAWVDPAAPGLVVELGGGTGVITAALLARGVAPQRLVVIEQSPALARHLAQRFPQVRVVQADAAELALLRTAPDWPRADDGMPLAVQCIVSGLPLLSIPSEVRQRILLAGAQVAAILCGWFSTQYPVFMSFRDGRTLTIQNTAAPSSTLFWLNTGLAVALACVIPLLVTLYRVFDATRRAD